MKETGGIQNMIRKRAILYPLLGSFVVLTIAIIFRETNILGSREYVEVLTSFQGIVRWRFYPTVVLPQGIWLFATGLIRDYGIRRSWPWWVNEGTGFVCLSVLFAILVISWVLAVRLIFYEKLV